MADFLIRRGEKHTGRRPCADGGRDWSEASTSQGMPRMAGNQQKLGSIHGTRLLKTQF